ncbi:MAG: radical SAM protein [Deltaproteobacteria bacterium]|nr:radical SAM protein [Deltaproteobacteria bacterium]
MIKTSDTRHRLIYGPVPSRRLGRSLGLDLVPFKTCSYDCIYCQLGRTQNPTVTRQAYVSPQRLLDQLLVRLEKGVHPDYITLGGSGEPTLNDQIGVLIRRIKAHTRIPVAVLTNGSLLGDPDVCDALLEADVVLPSLDACDETGFQDINRPHPAIAFDTMVKGLIAFRKRFAGGLWLEIFVIKGINDTEKQAEGFRRWIDRINPDRVHINTAVRPPAEASVRPVSREQMLRLCDLLGDKAEVVAPFQRTSTGQTRPCRDRDLLNILSRRPCTLEDLSSALGTSKSEITQGVNALLAMGKIHRVERQGAVYFQSHPKDPG